jgi:hypothetical protein
MPRETYKQKYERAMRNIVMLEKELRNARGEEEVVFDVTLSDGRVAHCWRAMAQPYSNCTFSAGFVEGLDPDDFYLCLEREPEEPTYLFLRRDELEALIWCGSGTLWARDVLDVQDTSELDPFLEEEEV